MSGDDIPIYALLAVGVSLEALAVAGLILMRDLFDRLHFLAPAGVGAVPIVAAAWLREGPSIIGLKGVVLAAILLAGSPMVAHAIARAARLAAHGDWRRRPEEGIEVEQP